MDTNTTLCNVTTSCLTNVSYVMGNATLELAKNFLYDNSSSKITHLLLTGTLFSAISSLNLYSVFKSPEIVNPTQAYDGTQSLLIEEKYHPETSEGGVDLELEVIEPVKNESKVEERTRKRRNSDDEIQVLETVENSPQKIEEDSPFPTQNRFEVITPYRFDRNEEKENTYGLMGIISNVINFIFIAIFNAFNFSDSLSEQQKELSFFRNTLQRCNDPYLNYGDCQTSYIASCIRQPLEAIKYIFSSLSSAPFTNGVIYVAIGSLGLCTTTLSFLAIVAKQNDKAKEVRERNEGQNNKIRYFAYASAGLALMSVAQIGFGLYQVISSYRSLPTDKGYDQMEDCLKN